MMREFTMPVPWRVSWFRGAAPVPAAELALMKHANSADCGQSLAMIRFACEKHGLRAVATRNGVTYVANADGTCVKA
jgi:hypothetical protein